MQQIVLSKANGTTVLLQSINPVISITKAEQRKQLLGINELSIEIDASVPVVIEIGDSILMFGERYTCNYLPSPEKISQHVFKIKATFESVQYDLLRAIYFDTDVSGFNTSPDFTLTGNLRDFADLVINNIGRVFAGQWSIGSCVSTEEKTISFNDESCLAVLQKICKEFDTEFEIIEDGHGNKVLNLGKIGTILAHTYEYGQSGGLYKLNRDTLLDKNVYNRLYLFGGNKNIPAGYRNNSLRLRTADAYLQDDASIASFGLIENTVTLEDIYPKRLGTVTSLGSSELIFTDASMDFDVNANLVAGVSPKINFNTGGLSGISLEISNYDHATQTFTVNTYQDDRGYIFPNATDTAFQIAVGDTYVLTDINFPSSYIATAEAKLLAEGITLLNQNKSPRVQYGLEIYEYCLKSLSGGGAILNFFNLGDYINIIDADMQINGSTRITGITRDCQYPYRYSLEVGDSVQVSIVEKVFSEIKTTKQIIKLNRLYDATRARMGWRNTQELLNMVFDTDGFFDTGNIKPLSINTSMLVVGVKSQQFVLQVVIEPNFQGHKNVVQVSNGTLVHYAIFENNVTWQIAGGNYTLPDDNARYIYAKCHKTDYNDGLLIFSTEQIRVDDDPSHFHFLVGTLHSVTNGVRWISLTYGATAINGRFIKTGRIQSFDGQTYFDLDTNEIAGKISFINANGDYKNLEELNQDLEDFVDSTTNFINTTYPTDVIDIKGQIDGKVETWFYNYVPTTENEPAVSWGMERYKHIDDLFFNTSTGIAYRYKHEGGVYSWDEVRDMGVTQALNNASHAQDTADHKRRIFAVQPYPPYDVGDLWTQGVSGEIMVCKTARETGDFVGTDWEKASKYTDDASLISFVDDIFYPTQTATQTQLDGKIEAWFQDADPNTWDAGERAKHDKDMWYHLTDKKLYRYKASTNSWERIQDTDALAAYELASRAQDTADGKRRIFVDMPYPPYDVGDLWTDGTDLRRCITQKLPGSSYNALDWNMATFYDNTKTTIDGGVVTSGRIQLAGDDTNIKAGITGQGTSDASVRFWAGTSYENRGIAPFRVLQDGSTYFRKKLILTDDNNQEQAGICGADYSGDGSIRAWFGETYANRAIAPCRFFADGTMIASKGKFGILEISGNTLKNDFNADAYIVLRNDPQNQFTGIGTNIYPTSSSVYGSARFEQGASNPSGWNIGSQHKASGGIRNLAIFASEGEALLNEATLQGRSCLTFNMFGYNYEVDVSKYDVIEGTPLAYPCGVHFVGTVYNGKEVTLINTNDNSPYFLYSTARAGTVEVAGGEVVTMIYSSGHWYVKSRYDNDF